jgi:hypothetical protein
MECAYYVVVQPMVRRANYETQAVWLLGRRSGHLGQWANGECGGPNERVLLADGGQIGQLDRLNGV